MKLMSFVFLFFFSFSFFNTSQANEPVVSVTSEVSCSKLIYSNVEIACFNQGVGIFSAEDRIEKIKKSLAASVQDSQFDPESITIVTEENVKLVMAGETILLHLTPQDLAATAGDKNFEASVQIVAQNIKQAIQNERLLKTPKKLILSIGLTVLSTLGLFLLLFFIKRLHFYFETQISKSHGTLIKTVKFQNYEILNSQRIISLLNSLNSLLRLFLTLVGLYIYIPLVFSFYPQTSRWTALIFGYILDPLKTISKVAINFIPNLFYILIITVLTNYLLKLIRFTFDELATGSLVLNGFHKEWADPTYKLVRLLVLAMALVMAFPYIPGSGSPAFQGVTVFFGVLVSLGSSSAISNVVAGIVLTYMRPFKTGDYVQIADTTGDVLEKSLLVTRIHTRKNVHVTIPNSMVLSNHIINYSSSALTDGLIVNTTITIGYDVPWVDVHKALINAAKKCQFIDSAKEPFVLQTALNDFSVAYELNAFTNKPNQLPAVYSELHESIQNSFNEAQIEIMSPHYFSMRDGNKTTIPEKFLRK